MTDVLDELREANPVDAEALDLPPAPSTPARARRRWQLVTVAAAVGVAALALVLARGGSSDLAARAYAATNGGIVHWRTEVTQRVNGRFASRQRMEGWASRWVTHVLHYDVVHGKARLTMDRRIADGQMRAWMAGSNDYFTGPAPKARRATPYPTEDPFATFRRAYRDGKLTRLGGDRYRAEIRNSGGPPITLDYELDPRTALPRRLVVTMRGAATGGRPASRDVLEFDFALYETLEVTPATRAKLALLPHPGAGPSTTPAAERFAALRDGAPPAAADERKLARMAHSLGRYHVDVAGIRVLAPGIWLMPGRGYVCMAVGNAQGTGGTCSTVDTAVRRGLFTGSPGGEVLIAVADDVTAVRARVPGRWRTFPVKDGLARLPWPVYERRLIR